MYQLTQALLYLKSVAVAHRDLKPSNISFNSQGELKLIDFDEAICFKESEELNNKDFGFARSFS
jgi:protein-serine/threonine kinase